MPSLTDKQKIRINRDVLAKFLPDKDSIRKFEDLLRLLNDLIPEDLQTLLELIEESLIEQGSNRSKINVQNSLIQILSKTVEIIESQPRHRPNKKPQLDYIDFYENVNVTDKPGRMYWKDKDLNIVMNKNSVTLQVGQEMYYLVKNESGSTINNGSLVKFSGVSDNKLVCSLAKGSDNINSIIGIATQDILNNGFGFVTYFGSVKGLNASGSTVSETWNNGNLLYPHPTINGGLTKTRPSSPNFKQPIAVVTDNSSTDGILLVRMTTGEKLTTLHDIEISSVSDGDLLQYNATNSRWENTTLTTGTGTVTSVAMSVPTGLSISGSPITTSGTLAVTLTTGYTIPTTTDSSNWDTAFSWGDHSLEGYVIDASYVHTDNNFTTSEQTKLSGIESGAEVNNIPNVEISSVSDGDILQYNSSNSRWENVSGASDTFISDDKKTVTVVNGIITSIVVYTTTDLHDIFGDSSAVATYNLDSNANDLGGTYNGTATSVSYQTGKFNNAALIENTTSTLTSKITIPEITLTNDFSISVWFKSNELKKSSLMGKNGSGSPYYIVASHYGANNSMALNINSTDYISSVPQTFDLDWHLYTYVRSGSTLYFYKDGYFVDSVSTSTYDMKISLIGGYQDGASSTHTNGLIDQIRMFNRALTSLEVVDLYNEQ